MGYISRLLRAWQIGKQVGDTHHHVIAASDNGVELSTTSSEVRVGHSHRSTKNASEPSAQGEDRGDDCKLHGADCLLDTRLLE